MTPSDEFALRVAAALRSGELAVPDALLPSIAARTARARQQRHSGLMTFARIVLQGGAALAVGWLAITMLQGMRLSTGPFDSATRGDFTLTISVPRDTYRVGEAIEPVATLTYRGPHEQVELRTAYLGPLYFGAERDGGPRIGPGWRDSCESVSLTRNVPLERGFEKSGGFHSGTPHADLFEWYLTGGRPLTLTPGTWHLFVLGHFNVGECGGNEADMRAAVTVVVEDGPLSATHSSGEFALTLSMPRTVYRVGEDVNVTATISYSGSGPRGISAGRRLVGIGLARGHGHAVTAPFLPGCEIHRTLHADQPVTIPFHLEASSFTQAGPGLWEIAAVSDFAASSDCSGPRVKLRALVAIEIRP